MSSVLEYATGLNLNGWTQAIFISGLVLTLPRIWDLGGGCYSILTRLPSTSPCQDLPSCVLSAWNSALGACGSLPPFRQVSA